MPPEYHVQGQERIWRSVEWQTQQLVNDCVWTRGIFTLDFYFVAIWFKTSHFTCSVVTSWICWGFCMGVTMWGWQNKAADGIGGSEDPCVVHGVPRDLPFATDRELFCALSLVTHVPSSQYVWSFEMYNWEKKTEFVYPSMLPVGNK